MSAGFGLIYRCHAVTADAYRDALSLPGVTEELQRLLDG